MLINLHPHRYLCTLAAAEQLYDALYQWSQIGAFTVTSTSLPFFRDFCSEIQPGTYDSASLTYKIITKAIRKYADGFLSIVEKYTPADGALAEQFNRDTGIPLSATDLTWSYASFLSATDRRAGHVPASWASDSSDSSSSNSSTLPSAFTPPSIPQKCHPSSTNGTYIPATKPTPCYSTPTSIAVTFNLRKTTIFGQNIFLTGPRPDLGNGAPEAAVPLSANTYTQSNPRWYVTLVLPVGVVVKYEYGLREEEGGDLRLEGGGGKYWEYKVEGNCEGMVSLYDVWEGG